MKAALIGCGRMGLNHAKALEKLGIELVAVSDPILLAMENIQNKFHNIKKYKDYINLLEFIAPELVVIATTASSHAEIAQNALKLGVINILLEKPIATSLASCREIKKLTQQNDAKLAVNHQMRYLPQYTIPRRLLNSNNYGGFKSMHVVAGNFGLAMNGTHYIEAFRYLANEAPNEVSANFDTEFLPNPRGAQFQDVSGCIRLTTASGKRLYIDTSMDQGHGVQVTYMSRNGRITVDELAGKMTTVVRQPQHREAPTSRYGMPVDIEEQIIKPVDLVDSTKAVLEALIKGKDYPTLQDGMIAVKALVAAYHSHRQGGVTVRLADIPDDDPEVFPWA